MHHQSITKESGQLIKETVARLNSLKEEIYQHLCAVREQREKHPNSNPYTINNDTIDELFRKCDSIRDYGEQIDINAFTTSLGQVETLLKKLRTPIQFRRTDILGDLYAVLNNLGKTIK
jgi:hypothetical protein